MCKLRFFASFIHSLIDQIKNHHIYYRKDIEKEHFELFFFLVEKMFKVDNYWWEGLPITIPGKISKDELDAIREMKSCDTFRTFHRYCQNQTEDFEGIVAYLLRTFVRQKTFNRLNYSWIAMELKENNPCIDAGFKSVLDKISSNELSNDLQEKNQGFKSALKGTTTLDDIVCFLQNAKGPCEEFNFETVLDAYYEENFEWDDNEESALLSLLALIRVRNILGRKKFPKMTLVGGGKRGPKRKVQENCSFTKLELSTLLECKKLLHADEENFKWIFDDEKVANKVFIAEEHTTETHKILNLLKLGALTTLKKKKQRVLELVKFVNGLLSKPESQQFLRDECFIEELDEIKAPEAKKIKEETSEPLIEAQQEELSEVSEEIAEIRHGFQKLGVTCYFNTSMQILFNCKPFMEQLLAIDCDNEWFKRIKHYYNMSKIGTVNIGREQFEKLMFNTSDMKDGFWRINEDKSMVSKSLVQGDPSEFIQLLFDQLEDFKDLFLKNNDSSFVFEVQTDELEENLNELILKKLSNDLEYLAPCLMIHLAREATPKNTTKVAIPEIITIENTTYLINAIAKHEGANITSGHWKAYCREENNVNANFVEYDEEDVQTNFPFDEILRLTTKECSLLTYVQCNISQDKDKRNRDESFDSNEIFQDSKRGRKEISEESLAKMSKEVQKRIRVRTNNRNLKEKYPEKYQQKVEKMNENYKENVQSDSTFKEAEKDRKAKLYDKNQKNKVSTGDLNTKDEKQEKQQKRLVDKQRLEQKRVDRVYAYNELLIQKWQRKGDKTNAEEEYLELLQEINQIACQVCSSCQRLNYEHKMIKSLTVQKAYERVKAKQEKELNKDDEKEEPKDSKQKPKIKKEKELNEKDAPKVSKSKTKIEYTEEQFYEDCIAIKNDAMHFCSTCANSFYRGNIPLYAPKTGIHLPSVPPEVSCLSDLEETLIKLVLPFMQVRELKPFAKYTEMGQKGPTINIHTNCPAVDVLPRNLNNTSVIQIKLKRHENYKNAYMFETISIEKVYNALKALEGTKHYKDIKKNFEALNQYEKTENGEVPFVTNTNDIDKKDLEGHDAEISAEEAKILRILENQTNEEYGAEGGELDTMVFQMPHNLDTENYEEVLHVGKSDTKEDDDKQQKDDANKFKLLEIAPGQGKKPAYSSTIEDYDEKCNPRVYGGNPLKYDSKKLSIIKRYKQQISIKDRRFCSPAMILFMAKRKLEHQLASCIKIAIRKGKKGKLTVKDILDPKKLKEMCKDDEAYRFMQNITITPGYLEKSKKKSMAFVRQLGHPTFFLTLSPKEYHWPKLLKALWEAKNDGLISEDQVMALSDVEKSELLRSDPVRVTQYFTERLERVLKYLQREANVVFGENWVVDFIRRREYQMRGAPHEHIILYCKDVIQYKRGMDRELKEKLIQFIDKVINCENDPANPLVDNQYHICTQTCWKKNKKNDKKCRFKFPRYPMKETKILRSFEQKDGEDEIDFKKRKDIAKKNLDKIKEQIAKYNELLKNHWLQQKKDYLVNDENQNENEDPSEPLEDEAEEKSFAQKQHEKFLNEFDTFDAMLEKLQLTYGEYLDALRSEINDSEGIIFHKRAPNAININGYNKEILDAWQSNMDLQLVLQPYAAISYLFSYILKADKGLIRLMTEAIGESKEAGAGQKALLSKIANAFNNAAIIGASQAADYLMGVPMTRYSRDVLFINTNRPQNRIGIKKKTTALEEMCEDDTDIFEHGLIERYANRHENFNKWCLADFAAKFKTNFKDDSPIDKILRLKPRVIRYVGFNETKNEAEFYRERLMLYHPWTDEKTELDDLELDELKAKYDANHFEIMEKHREYNKIEEHTLREYRDKAKQEEDDDDDNAGVGFFQHRRDNDEDEYENFDAFGEGDDDYVGDGKERRKKKTDKKDGIATYQITLPPRVPDDKIEEILMKFNSDQRRIVYAIYDGFRNGVKSFKIFITGTAGTGKSFVINALYQIMTNYFDKNTDNPDDKDSVKVLLTAPTGVAAFLIGGVTAHQAFKLPTGRGNFELSESISNTIYSQLRHVEIIIIDEISFISNEVFHIINTRLQQIFGNNEPFGGKCVIAVGDLCQLPPIKGRPIYTSFVEMKDPKNVDAIDYLKDLQGWFSFKIYELQQVMRQKNPAFIKMLSNLSKQIVTDEDFKLLKSRHFPENKVPRHLTRIFYTNKKAREWNEKVFEENKNEMFVSEAEDKPIYTHIADRCKEKQILDKFKNDEGNSMTIHHTLKLKKGIRIMLTHNIDTSDGLVNGAMGTIEEIRTRPVQCNGKTIQEPHVIFIKFDLDVGKKRKLCKEYPQLNGCVPLVRDAIEIVKQDKGGREIRPFRILRKQFLITMAAGITIHKAQGQTLPKGVGVDVSDICNRLTLLFVACSRTDYENLYLFGTLTRPRSYAEEQEKFKRSKKNKRNTKEKETEKKEDDEEELLNEIESEDIPPAHQELERMRKEARFEISHHLFETKDESSHVIMYQNINGYKGKAKFILSDAYYENADVLIFSEANVNVLLLTQYPSSFEVIFPRPEDNFKANPHSGLVILAKPETIKSLSNVDIKRNENGHIDLRSFIVGNTFVITGYKSPKINSKTFCDELNSHMKNAPCEMHITLIGDFNFEAGKRDDEYQRKVIQHLEFPDGYLLNKDLANQLSPHHTTTIRGTQIDTIFSNSNQGCGGVYTAPYISDHYLIYYLTVGTRKLTCYEREQQSLGYEDNVIETRTVPQTIEKCTNQALKSPDFKNKNQSNKIPDYNELETQPETSFEISHQHLLANTVEYSCTVMYHNIDGYDKKSKFIMDDPFYEKAEVLIFSRADVKKLTKYPSSFEVVFPKNKKDFILRPNSGLVILAKPDVIENLSDADIKKYRNGHIDLRSFIADNNFFVTGYKSPNIDAKTFCDELNSHIKNAPCEMYITLIGDFNFEAGKRNDEYQRKVIKNLEFPNGYLLNTKFSNKLSPYLTTSQSGTQTNTIFSNAPRGRGGVYEASFMSSHYLIYYLTDAKIKQEFNSIPEIIEDENQESKPTEDTKEECIQNEEKNSIPQKIEGEQNEESKPTKLKKPCIIESERKKKATMTKLDFLYVLFENSIELKDCQYANLCAFNACTHAFIALIKKDENFKNFAQSNLHLSFITLLFDLIQNPEDRNQRYLEFIKNNFKIKDFDNNLSLTRDMFWEPLDVLQKLFEDDGHESYSWEMKCLPCDALNNEFSISTINIGTLVDFHNAESLEIAFNTTTKRSVNLRDRQCKKCAARCTFTEKYGELLIIAPEHASLVAETEFSIPYDLFKLANKLQLGGKLYELKVVINHKGIGHVNSYVKDGEKFLFLDDAHKEEGKIAGRYEEYISENNVKDDSQHRNLNVRVLIYIESKTSASPVGKISQEILQSSKVSVNLSETINEVEISEILEEYEEIDEYSEEESQSSQHSKSEDPIFSTPPRTRKILTLSNSPEKYPIQRQQKHKVRLENTIKLVPFDIDMEEKTLYLTGLNMSCMNANAHGFLHAMYHNEDLRHFIEKEIERNSKEKYREGDDWKERMLKINDHTLFRVLHIILFMDNSTLASNLWMHFVQTTTSSKVFRKNFSFNFSMSIQNFYDNKRMLGSFSSVIDIACKQCSVKRKIESSIINVNFKNNLFNSLPQDINDSILLEFKCKHSSSKKRDIKVAFGKLVMIMIKRMKNSANKFTHLKVCNIPEEIILPGSDGKINYYMLQFIQNLKDDATNTYSAIMNGHDELVEYPNSGPIHNVALNEDANPQFLVYFEHNNEILLRPLFENKFNVEIELNSRPRVMKKIRVYNMCCFNSFMNPLQRLMRTNKSCFQYIKQNQHLRFFKLLINIYNETSKKVRDKLWIQFIYNNSSMMADRINLANSVDMATNPAEVLETAFNVKNCEYSYCTIEIHCAKCKEVSKQDTKIESINVTVSAKSIKNLSTDIWNKTLANNRKRNVCLNEKCKNAKGNRQIYRFHKFLFVHVARTSRSIISNFNVDIPEELNFNDIPKTLVLNDTIFKLGFFHNFYPSYAHYTALFAVPSIDSHLEIDDLTRSNINILSNNDYHVNPKFLVYYRNE